MKTDSAAKSSQLTNWFVKPARVNRFDVLLYINEATKLPIVVPGTEFLRVEPNIVFKHLLIAMMVSSHFTREKANQYLKLVLTNGQVVPQVTTNFAIERANQEYQASLANFNGPLLDETDQEKLFNNLLDLSLQLAQSRDDSANQPLALFTRRVQFDLQNPVSVTEKASEIFREYAQFSDDHLVTAEDPRFESLAVKIRKLNGNLLDYFKQYLAEEGETSNVTSDDAWGLVENYLNDYLLQVHPLTIVSDLTNMASFMASPMAQKSGLSLLEQVWVFEQFGKFLAKALWSYDLEITKDYLRVLYEAQKSLAKAGNKDDPQLEVTQMESQIQQVFMFMLKKDRAMLTRIIMDLPAEQRQELKRIVDEIETRTKH